MNTAWEGAEKDHGNRELSLLHRHCGNWWDTVSVHTYSMKASIQKKIGALWPSRQHCHKNNGQRLVVNKFVLENISILFTQGEDRKK